MSPKIIPMEDDKIVVRTEEEVKTSIISDLGLDPEVDAERIEKLTARELDHDKKLSSAIGAKIKHRTEAEDLRKKIPIEVPPKTKEKKDDLSFKDGLAIMNAKVPEEDVDDVLDYAKFKGISISEALKSSVVRTTLAEKAEFRKTAAAANIGPTKKTGSKLDDATVIDETFRGGKIPEKGSEEAERLFFARHKK